MLPSSPSRASRSPAYGPGAGTPCHRAAAKTRLGCCLIAGRSASQASTSGSSTTPAHQSAKHGDSVRVPPEVAVLPDGLAVRVHADVGQSAGIATYVVSRYSSIPSKPPSRPNPLAFTPPNGAAGLETSPVLMPTMPKSSDSASRMVRARSLV